MPYCHLTTERAQTSRQAPIERNSSDQPGADRPCASRPWRRELTDCGDDVEAADPEARQHDRETEIDEADRKAWSDGVPGRRRTSGQ